MRRAIIAAIVLTSVMAPAAARSREVNAATWYRRAQERLATVPRERLESLFQFAIPGSGAVLTEEDRQLLVQLRPALAMARQGSLMEYSDFGLDYSQGPELMLPHVNQLRTMARLIGADATLRMSEGDTAGAADDFASMYRMADHCGRDGIIISSLVGQAIFTLANNSAQTGLDSGKFTPEDAAKMMLSLQRMPGADPFDYVEAIFNEQESVMSWMREKLEEEDGPVRLVEAWGLGSDDPKAAAVMALTPEEFEADVAELDGVVDRVAGIFLLDDPEQARAAMKDLEKVFDEGAGGILLSFGLVPAYGKVLERKLEVEEALASRLKLLKGLVSGETTPDEAANAALWYLRGIEKLRELGPEKLSRISAAAADPVAGIDEALAAVLKDASAVVDVFREASQKKRCDFSVAGPVRQRVLRGYVGGMRAAARLLHADAIRSQQGDDAAGLVDRLSIGFRLSAHLAGDGALISSLASHRIFETSAALIPVKEKECTLPMEQRKELLNAVEAASRRDPFQYIESLTSERRVVGGWIREAAKKARDEAEAARAAAAQQQRQPGAAAPASPAPARVANRPADLAKTIDGWDGERVLAMEIALEMLRTANPDTSGSGAEVEARALGELDDVVEAAAIASARQLAALIKADLATEMTDQLSTRQLEAIAPIVKRMGEARQDVRRAVTLLQPKLVTPQQPPARPGRESGEPAR